MSVRHIITSIPNTPINIEILQCVFGQLSDGIWENSKKMIPFWLCADVSSSSKYVSFEIANIPLIPYLDRRYSNPYYGVRDSEVVRIIAERIPTIIRAEAKDIDNKNKNFRFAKGNLEHTKYLSYQLPISINDCYILYHALLDNVAFLDYIEKFYTAKQIIYLKKIKYFDFSMYDFTKNVILPLNNTEYLQITPLVNKSKVFYIAYFGNKEQGLNFPLEDKPDGLYNVKEKIQTDLRGFSPRQAAKYTIKYSSFSKILRESLVDMAVMSNMSIDALNLQLKIMCIGLNIDTTSEWISKNTDIF